MVTPRPDIHVYNDKFDDMEGVIQASAMPQTQWMENLYNAMKFVWHKLSKYYAEVTPMTGMLHIVADVLDPFRIFWLFRMWNKGMNTNPEDQTCSTIQ